jgi:P-type E1-E2 ATPase
MLENKVPSNMETKRLTLDIPGHGPLELRHLVLDLNGTVALDGELLPGVAERMDMLRDRLVVYLITADTHGQGTTTAHQLDIELHRLAPGQEAQQKGDFVHQLGAPCNAAVGNGANDALMLATAGLGIAVSGREGLAIAALQAADLVVPNIIDALDLLLYPKRLMATLRR